MQRVVEGLVLVGFGLLWAGGWPWVAIHFGEPWGALYPLITGPGLGLLLYAGVAVAAARKRARWRREEGLTGR